MTAHMPLGIQLMGGFRVTLGEQTLLDGRSRQRRAASLIKLLALAPGFRLHREQVMDVLWPDLDPEAATNNLNYTVHTARRLLGTSIGRASPFLRREGDFLVLGCPERICVDVCAFESAAEEARKHNRSREIDRALEHYTGDLLPDDRYEDWAVGPRERLQTSYLNLLREQARLGIEQYDYKLAVSALQRVLEVEPSDEDAHLQLMRVYALNGQRARALSQYRRLKAVLQREFDTEPSPSTLDLYQSIAQRRFPAISNQVTDSATAPRRPPADRTSKQKRRSRQATLVVGRAQEIAVLRDRLAHAIEDGTGGLVLIRGEAGIGKTTLVRTLATEAAEQDVLVLTGHCYDLTVTPPYGLWADIARSYPSEGDLPPFPDALLDVEALHTLHSQTALFEAVLEFLTRVADHGPLLLILEDLHWCDLVSIDLFRFVARHLKYLPILMVTTYRIDEITRDHPLNQLEPVLTRETDAERITLRRLDDNALREFIHQRYSMQADHEDRLVDYLRTRTTGNPLFVAEVLRSLIEEGVLRRRDESWEFGDPSGISVPSLVHQVIERRLMRVDAEPRRLLGVAAVLGQEVSLDVWSRIADVSYEVLLETVEQAAKAHLLEESSDRLHLRFVHALVREALYENIILPRRIEWHRRAGDVLAGSPGSDPDTVAFHFQQAKDPRAADWLIRAGERAERAFDWRTATERFAAASRWLDGDETRTRDRGWLLYRAAQVRMYFDPVRGISELDEALRLAANANDPVLYGISLFRRGHLRCFAGDIRLGLKEMHQGLDRLEALCAPGHRYHYDAKALDPDTVVQLNRGNLLIWLAIAGRYREALQHDTPQLLTSAPMDRPGNQQVTVGWIDLYDWINAYHGIGEAYAMMGQLEKGRANFEFALDAYRTAEVTLALSHALQSFLTHVTIPYYTDHLEERIQLAEQMEHWWKRGSAAMPPGVIAGVQRAPLLVIEGALNEVRSIAARSRDWQADINQHPHLLTSEVIAAQFQGDEATAWELIHAMLPDGARTEPGNCYFLPALGLLQAAVELSLEQGNLEHARAWLDTHYRWVVWSQALYGQAGNSLLESRYHWAAGNITLARQNGEDALRQAADPRQPLVLLAAYRTLGEFETAARNFTEAEDYLSWSLSLAEDCEAPFERALTLLSTAELRIATNDIVEARARLSEVRAICDPIGARPTLARVDALENQLSTRRNRSPYLVGLTSREVEVLRLVVQGMSDREIAINLGISHHTVARHVSHILDKLDVESRTAAAAYAVRSDIV